jgi:hypothetical protein
MFQTFPIHIDELLLVVTIHFYVGVDPNFIDQVNEVRARSAGGVPGRRHNLMVSKNLDIINGLFFILPIHLFSYAHFQE